MAVEPASEKQQSPWRRLAVPVLTLVAVVLLGLFLWNQKDELQKAFETSWEYFVLLIVLNLVGQFVNATEYWMLYRAGGATLDWTGNMSAYNAGQLGNYLPLQAGSVYRLHFMKQIYGISYPRSITTYAQNLVITVAAGGVCGLIGVFGTAMTTGESFSWIMFGVSAGMCASALVFALVPLPKANWLPGKVKHWWRDFHTGWEIVRRNPKRPPQGLAVRT